MEQPATSERPAAEQLSFMDKAVGVFYEPSKVFESFKTFPVKMSDWLVPVILLAIVTGVSAYVRSASPDLRFQMAQQMEQQLDKMVAQGKITADQAESAKETMGNVSSSSILLGILSAVANVFILFFASAAIWLFIGKIILKGNVTYSQMMGVAGLSSWVMIVGAVLGIVMMILLSRVDGGLHLGLLMQMDPSSKTYLLLKNINLFTIWNLAVVSMGIGTLSGKKGAKPVAWVFGIWIVLTSAMVFMLGGIFGA